MTGAAGVCSGHMTTTGDSLSRPDLLARAQPPSATARTRRAIAEHAPLGSLALLAAGVPLFVWGSLADQVVTPRLAATALLTGLACVGLALRRGRRIDLAPVLGPLALLAMLVVWSALATALGADRGGSLLGEYLRFQGLLPLVMYALLLLTALLVTAAGAGSGDATPARALVGAVFGGAVAVAGYAIIQRLGLDWVRWSGIPPGRVGSAFAQPNVLGVELATALVASFGLWRGRSRWQRAVALGGRTAILAALLFTLSRGAWVGAAVGMTSYVAFALAPQISARGRRQPPMRRPRITTAGVARAGIAVLPVVAVVVALAGAFVVGPGGRRALVDAGRRARSSGRPP